MERVEWVDFSCQQATSRSPPRNPTPRDCHTRLLCPELPLSPLGIGVSIRGLFATRQKGQNASVTGSGCFALCVPDIQHRSILDRPHLGFSTFPFVQTVLLTHTSTLPSRLFFTPTSKPTPIMLPLLSLFSLLAPLAAAVPCVQFDTAWNLYAFGGTEDVNLGQASSWARK